jgi:hypothetical protein
MTEQTSNIEPTTPAPKKLYATRAEADTAKPENAPRLKLFEVVKDGQSRGFVRTDGPAATNSRSNLTAAYGWLSCEASRRRSSSIRFLISAS